MEGNFGVGVFLLKEFYDFLGSGFGFEVDFGFLHDGCLRVFRVGWIQIFYCLGVLTIYVRGDLNGFEAEGE